MPKAKTKPALARKYRVELGKRLARARGAERTQADIASLLQEKPNTYRRWEAGEVQFPMYHMHKFSSITGFSVHYLVTGDLTYGPTQEPNRLGIETGDFTHLKNSSPT